MLRPIVLAPHKAHFFSTFGRMPRLKSAINYKNDILINIILELLPNGEYGWHAVSFAYHEQSKEKDPRNTDNLKRHWIKILCNGMKKLTGKPGGPDDRINRCISIEKRIMDKTHLGMLGLSSDDKDNVPRGSGAGEDNDPFGEELVGGGGVNESFESAQDEDDDGNTDAAVEPGNLPPLPGPVGPSALTPPPRKVQDTGDNKGVMTAPSAPASSAWVEVRGALKRAESLVKAQKTKMHQTRTRSTHCLRALSSSSSRRTIPCLMACL
jgi:hypothetical protein